jgi:hypothetical protein
LRAQKGNPLMNQNHRYQQNHYQHNGSQYHNRSQYDPNRYKRQDLERELRQLYHRLTELDSQIDALWYQGRQLEADLQAHHQAIPATVALEIGRAVANALHVPFLPPMYRNWHYKRERLLEAQRNLKYRAIQLKAQRDVLEQQIAQTQIDIDLLKYS